MKSHANLNLGHKLTSHSKLGVSPHQTPPTRLFNSKSSQEASNCAFRLPECLSGFLPMHPCNNYFAQLYSIESSSKNTTSSSTISRSLAHSLVCSSKTMFNSSNGSPHNTKQTCFATTTSQRFSPPSSSS